MRKETADVVPGGRTEGLDLPRAQALASALIHFAGWSQSLDHRKKPYNLDRQWFGVNVPSSVILDAEETRLLHAILTIATGAGALAQALLARLENQRALDRIHLREKAGDEFWQAIGVLLDGLSPEEVAMQLAKLKPHDRGN